MKKSYIIGIMVTAILAIVAGIIVIFFTNKNTKVNKTEQIAKQIENTSVNIEVISTAASEEKTSPSTVFVFNTKYNSCGHENSKTIEIPEELVDLQGKERKEKVSEDFLKYGKPKKNFSGFKKTPTTTPKSTTYAVGDAVMHKVFGKGTIVRADKMGNDQMLQIAFDTAGTKTLMANFCKMEKL